MPKAEKYLQQGSWMQNFLTIINNPLYTNDKQTEKPGKQVLPQ